MPVSQFTSETGRKATLKARARQAELRRIREEDTAPLVESLIELREHGGIRALAEHAEEVLADYEKRRIANGLPSWEEVPWRSLFFTMPADR